MIFKNWRPLFIHLGSDLKPISKGNLIYTLLISILLLFSCNKTSEEVFIDISSTEIASITDIKDSTATLNCVMSFQGKGYLLVHGICWSTNENPTIENDHVVVTDTGKVALKMSKLTPGTLYYVRPYIVTNDEGIGYENELSFTTKNIPTITIAATPTNLTAISATFIGTVSNDGGDSVTVRGVCWSTRTQPTVALATKTTNGAGKGSFNADASGLAMGTTYYSRVFATNAFGTAYSNEIAFTTKRYAAVTTDSVSAITSSTAICGGDVTNDGGLAVTARGVCWSTYSNPTISYSKTSDGAGIGSFTSSLTGLILGTTYHVRAYATNSAGTSYGVQQTFTTIGATVTTNTVSAITSSSATCGGNVTNDGGLMVSARGVCWSTSSYPTISNSKTSDGAGTGAFTSSITGLSANTTYYVRAYATNELGISYGAAQIFTTTNYATVTTNTVSAITSSSATCGGNVTASGGASVTARGVCWSTSSTPTISDSKTTEGAGTGAFTSSITGLTPGTIYYVRAYASNSAGTSYGVQQIFTTIGATVTTSTVSAITSSTATCGGNVTSDGGASITTRGVCWSTSHTPTISDSKTTPDSIGIGAFTSSITGLTPGTTYYVRAYVTNSVGTSYGAEQIFITKTYATVTTSTVSAITSSTATSGGTITSDEGLAVTARGVCWSNTSTTPTISDSKTVDGAGTGSFTSSITGLTPGTTYYVRAYVTNSAGTRYGAQQTFTTIGATVTTNTVSDITSSSATCGGTVTNDGGLAVTARGVCWSTSSAPTISNSKTSDGAGTGAFTSSITGLSAKTTYYVRAYAINVLGTSYGAEQIFITKTYATVTTRTVSAITSSSATCGGDVTNDGGLAVTARGVCWSTSSYPTIYGSKTSDGEGTGSFTSSITGLTPGTTCYVRAYAINSAGTSYGVQQYFTTPPVYATVTTNTVSAITSSSATCGGNVTADGGGAVTARGVCWSTSSAPTISDNKTSNARGTGVFTGSITGLTPGTTYYVRAYATNSAGISYGAEQIFTTLPVYATVTTNPVSAVTSSSATCGGNVTADGGGAVTARGVCWIAAPNIPTIYDSKTSDGGGTGSFTSSITGLSANTTYYVRTYTTNSAGTSYGAQQAFITTSIVTTNPVSAITSSTATCGGTVNDGGLAVTARGVCWSTSSNPTIAGSKTTDGEGAGLFTSSITGLTPSATYYVRAYATNSAGTSYGVQQTFTTLSVYATVTTDPVSAITSSTATCGVNVTVDGEGIGGFFSSITGLAPVTTYYVRAYASNSAETSYGVPKNIPPNLLVCSGVAKQGASIQYRQF